MIRLSCCPPFVALVLFSLLSFVSSQYTGSVRCYVCKSNNLYGSGIGVVADCPDIYNKLTTTITYCGACLKYVGSVTNYTNGFNNVVNRGCYDDSVYNSENTGILQRSGLNEPSSGSYARKTWTAFSGSVAGVPNAIGRVTYGPGNFYVCNDGDLCNTAIQARFHVAGAGIIFFGVLYQLLLVL